MLEKNILAVKLEHEQDWHTYWKFPGDSGLPTKFTYSVNNSVIQINEVSYSMPKQFSSNGESFYGYSDDAYFFFRTPKVNNGEEISLLVEWLACKDVCIPGKEVFRSRIIDLAPQIALENQMSLKEIEDAYSNQVIKIDELQVSQLSSRTESINKVDEMIYASIEGLTGVKSLIPFPSDKVSFSSPKRIEQTFAFSLTWESNSEFKFDQLPIRFLVDDIKGVRVVEASIDSKISTPVEISGASQQSLLYILFIGFVGGLILNLMPCVLPVISFKLFGLIKSGNKKPKQIFKHNMLYTAGVMVSLLTLALVIVLIKSSGENIGWGFQLQSPLFVSIITIILFLMTLNMFGLFEFRTPGGSKLGNLSLSEDSWLGDFFSGVLATILSTPCSAPFLGTALAFAFSEPSGVIFLVFSSIGLGLASPFILTAFFPSALKVFPKPGLWMVKLKYFLGLTLLLTMFWLLDILHAMINPSYLTSHFYILLGIIFFSIFSFQRISKNKLVNLIFLLIVTVTTQQYVSGIDSNRMGSQGTTDGNWMSWSPELMTTIKSNPQVSFIDFTAKWCMTCQVNKKLVLHTDSFKKMMKDNQVDLYKADWTNQDKGITNWLAQNDVVGIPAYFIIRDGKVIHLGETISLSKINKYLK